jgi:RNA polymerase sigma-70 factor, ECF subfamily
LHTLATRAIDQLLARTRAFFQLIRLEGMSYKEVSGQLDISEKAVEKEMMKALKLLREALKDYLVVLIFLKIFL